MSETELYGKYQNAKYSVQEGIEDMLEHGNGLGYDRPQIADDVKDAIADADKKFFEEEF